jgi:hypothetical protein
MMFDIPDSYGLRNRLKDVEEVIRASAYELGLV